MYIEIKEMFFYNFYRKIYPIIIYLIIYLS